MADLGTLMMRIGVDVADGVAGITGFARELEGLATSVDRNFAALDKIGDRLTSLGVGLTGALTAPLAAIGLAAGKAAMDFDEASDTIRAKTGAVGADLARMEESFRGVFASVPNSAKDVTDALTTIRIGLGATGEPLEQLSTQMLNLSRLMGESIAPLGASVSHAFNDWSVSISDAGAKLDYLYRVAQSTGVGVTTLTTELKNFGGPLRALGLDFEQSAVMLGTFEKAGVNLQTVMPGLRTAIKTFAGAGLEGADAFKAFIEKVKGLDDAQATLFTKTVVGGRAFVDMFRAIKEGRLDLDDLTAAMKKGGDTINKAAEDTLSFADKLKRFRNELEVALEPLGKVLVGAMENALDGMKPLLDKVHDLAVGFSQLAPSTQTWILALGGAAAAAGPLLMLIGQMASGIAALAPAFGLALVGMVKFVTYLSDLNPAIATVTAGSAALALGIVAAGTALAAIEIKGIASDFHELGNVLTFVEQNTANSRGSLEAWSAAGANAKNEIDPLCISVQKAAGFFDELGSKMSAISWTSLLTPLGAVRQAFADVVTNLKILVGYYPAMDAAQQKLNATMTVGMKATADSAIAAGQLALAHKNLSPTIAANTSLLDALGKKHGETAAQIEAHRKKMEELGAQMTKFENQFHGTENVSLALSMFGDFDAKADEVKAKLEELLVQYQVMAKAIKTTADANAAFDMKWAREAIKDIADLANAFDHFGIVSKLAYDDATKASDTFLATVLNSNKSTIDQKQQAWIKHYQEMIDLDRKAGKTISDQDVLRLDQMKTDFAKAHMDLEQAFDAIGSKSAKSAQDNAEIVTAAYNHIVESYKKGDAEIGDVERARLAKYQADAAAMIAAGKAVPEDWKVQMDKLAQITKDGHKTMINLWGEFTTSVGKTVATGLDNIWTELLTKGKVDLKSALNSLWQDIAKDFVNAFIKPMDKAIGDFIAKSIKSLIGGDGFGGITKSVKELGTEIGKVFGVGADAAKTTTGAAAAPAASAGGSLGEGLGSVTSIVGAVSGVVSAISGVVSNFQFAHMNTALGRIEESTRKTWIVTGEQSDSILQTLHDSRAFLDDIRARVSEIRPALFDPVTVTIDRIVDFLSGTLGPWLRDNTGGGGSGAADTTPTPTDGATDPAVEVMSGVLRSVNQLGEATYLVGGRTAHTIADAVMMSQSDSTSILANGIAAGDYNVAQTSAAGSTAVAQAVIESGGIVADAVNTTTMSVLEVRAKLEDIGSSFDGVMYNTTQEYNDLKATLIGKSIDGTGFAGVSPLNGWTSTSTTPIPRTDTPVAPYWMHAANGSTTNTDVSTSGSHVIVNKGGSWTNAYSDTGTGASAGGGVTGGPVTSVLPQGMTPTATGPSFSDTMKATLDVFAAKLKEQDDAMTARLKSYPGEFAKVIKAIGDDMKALGEIVQDEKRTPAEKEAAQNKFDILNAQYAQMVKYGTPIYSQSVAGNLYGVNSGLAVDRGTQESTLPGVFTGTQTGVRGDYNALQERDAYLRWFTGTSDGQDIPAWAQTLDSTIGSWSDLTTQYVAAQQQAAAGGGTPTVQINISGDNYGTDPSQIASVIFDRIKASSKGLIG